MIKSKKNGLFTVIIFINCYCLYAQPNLVNNFSFEIYDSCPTGFGQLSKAPDWFQPNIFGNSTDYFNSCAVQQSGVAVPYNYLGNQIGKFGIAYAGFLNLGGPDYREYLEAQLNDSLLNGEIYCITFYVSLSDESPYATDGIGLYLSNQPVYYNSSTYAPLPYTPQISNPSGNIITDTINWTLIKQNYIAAGGEKYIVIGNFNDDNSTDTMLSNPNSFGNWSYLYIDNVSVQHGICSVGIDEVSDNNEINVYPNPSSGKISFGDFNPSAIEIYDSSVNLIIAVKNKREINMQNYENGLYIARIIDKSGKTYFRKIILNHD